MSKKLVAYFSASGVTAQTAKILANTMGADLYEIEPEVPYTKADLNWQDKGSRSTLEMNDPGSRPAIAGAVPDLSDYDVMFVGFPIWWYKAPTIINTFLERCNLTGKKIIPFATSGGSGMSGVNESLQPSCGGGELLSGKLLNGRQTRESLAEWIDELGI